jgi:hypothetical protein
MAKKKKDTFAEMLKELTAGSLTVPKSIGSVMERRYFLIVCEGAKTEPAYFEHLQGMLPKNLLTTTLTLIHFSYFRFFFSGFSTP